MPDRVISSSQFSGPPSSCVLLEEFASIGDRRNATTAKGLTSAGGTVQVSFELVDPPGISRWFVNFSSREEPEFKRKPQILNADDSLVLMRMAISTKDGRVIDYFVYKAGPGKPSLDLIPGPYPKIYVPPQIGILPYGDEREHYAVVFPAPRFEVRMGYEMHIFSSGSQKWSTKVAKVATNQETGIYDVLRHKSSKAISAGGSWIAWFDLWHGVLLCNVLDNDPILQLLQWPVPLPQDVCTEMYAAHSIRDATLSNGVVRFVEVNFDSGDAGEGWTATIWRRDVGSEYWHKCFKIDVANILANNSSFSPLLRKVWDDEVNKRGLNKVFSAPPTLSLSSEDVVYFKTKLKSDDSEALLLTVNAREAKLEAVKEIPFRLIYCPCTFSSFDHARTGADVASKSKVDIRRQKENLDPLSFYAMSLLLAQDQLMQLAACIAYDRPDNSRCRSLLKAGPESYLCISIQNLEQGAIRNSRRQASSKAMNEYMRAIGDIFELAAQGDLSLHIEAMSSKIKVALGAIDKLLQTVPESALEDGRELAAASLSRESVDGNCIAKALASHHISEPHAEYAYV